MSTYRIRHLILSLFMTLSVTGLANAAKLPMPLPETQFQEFTSKAQFNASDLQGKVIYLDFWASWCVPCRKSFPFMNELSKRYDSEKFQVIAVNMDEEQADAEAFLAQYPAQFSIVTNPNNALAKKLNIPGLPVAYIINADGMILARHIGFNSSKKRKKLQQLDSLLG